jgi:diaminopimelate decarboxylase
LTGDTFATQRDLPVLAAGELVVIRDTGAYGAVMASGYNSRPLIAEVLVRGSGFSVVRARQEIAAMLAQETLADWQT